MKILKTASYKKAELSLQEKSIEPKISVNRYEPAEGGEYIYFYFIGDKNKQEERGFWSKDKRRGIEIDVDWLSLERDYRFNKEQIRYIIQQLKDDIEDKLENSFISDAEQGSLEFQDYPESSYNRYESPDPMRPSH